MKLHIYADFNSLTFKRFFESLSENPFEEVICSEYNQLYQALVKNHTYKNDIAFVIIERLQLNDGSII